jgi:CubicO group peptidase (beta-lactamase class C family)
MKLRSLAAPLAVVALLSLIALAWAPTGQLTRDGAAAPRDLSGIIAPVLEASRLPALGTAIATSAGLEAIGASGVRSWNGTEKVTADDHWHLGSCTKAMTATLVARLIEQGVLGWETTIGNVFGPTTHPDWKDVPIAWLLSHRSGAPLNFSDELWEKMVARGGSPREQRRFFVEESLKVAPPVRPNTETVYSNAGFIVSGAMLEALTDTSWEDLMRREVLVPLGMTRTGFGAPGTPGRLDQPLGHTRGADGWSPVALGPNADNPTATGPAGTIHTTLSDWARFIAAHLRGARGDESYLQSATWQRLHSPGESDWGYSPGWVVTEQEWAGGRLLRHLGSNSFWLAEASLAVPKDFAVLIVANVSDDSAEAPFHDLLAALIADHAAHVR